ncbi:hypothetical protein FRC17_006893 [Serendipita sp. 399]|nr:hypothetical protein FRC17_006893 [Serendipita sp. 399]
MKYDPSAPDDDEERQYLRQALDKDYRPPDPYVLYNKKAVRDEENILEDCNETMDTLLVFAGLFSAVTTALIVETYKDLKPEPEAYMEKLLETLLKNQVNSSGRHDTVARPDFVASKDAVVTNSLFFASLAFSLLAALAAILLKQWIRKLFLSIKKRDSPRLRAKEHIRKRKGIDDWGIPGMIALIPMMLHVALACFFAGLIVWLRSLHRAIYVLIILISASALVLYISAAIIPSFHPNAPFHWPVSFAVASLLKIFPRRGGSVLLSLSLSSYITMRPGNTPVMSTPLEREEPTSDLTREKAIDEIDLLVFSNITDQMDSIVETEAVVETLRCHLTANSPQITATSPAFKLIFRRAIEFAESCRVYQCGEYDIRPGVPLERLTTIARFIEVAMQVVYLDTEKDKYQLQKFMELAELMLERAKYIQSPREVALYGSIVARLHTRFHKWDHFGRIRDNINAIRDLGPRPRSWNVRGFRDPRDAGPKREWTFQEIYQWQQILPPFLLALTHYIAARFPPGNTEPMTDWYRYMTDDATELLCGAVLPTDSGRKDNYPPPQDSI